MDEVVKVRDGAISSANEKGRDARMLESRISLLEEALDFLKRNESTGRDMEIVNRKLADAKNEVNNLVDGSHRDTFDSYTSIRHNVNQTLLSVGSRLRDLIDREGQELQWSVHATLRNAASGVQGSFVGAPAVGDRSPNLVYGHARPDELAKTGPSTTHSANHVSRRCLARVTFDKGGAPEGDTPQSSAAASPRATDLRDYSGQC